MKSRQLTGLAGILSSGSQIVARCSVALFALLACQVVAAASNVVEYTRDAAGNITAISRQGTTALTITAFSPTSGPVGTTVTISGTGFSPSPSGNTVAFNATAVGIYDLCLRRVGPRDV